MDKIPLRILRLFAEGDRLAALELTGITAAPLDKGAAEQVLILAHWFHEQGEFDVADFLTGETLSRAGFQPPFAEDGGHQEQDPGGYFFLSGTTYSVYDFFYRRQSVECGGVDVFHTKDLAGGGEIFGQDFVNVVAERSGPVERAFEWCCGPSFIGFALLGRGLCRTLCGADVNPKAVAASNYSARRNGLSERTTLYLSDGLRDIPASERWDLVIANPPMAREPSPNFPGHPRLSVDAGWRLHEDFYSGLAAHLKDGGRALVQETRSHSCADDFRPMIEAGGLEVEAVLDNKIHSDIYYLSVAKASG